MRIAAKGTIMVMVDEHVQRARIGNLGGGGLLARTHVTAPSKLLGRITRVEIRLDGPNAEWLGVNGRIVRIEASSVAVTFPEAPAEYLRMLDVITTASHGDQRMMSVVLIDEDTERREAIAEAFRSSGCIVVDVASPLEAVVRLGELPFEPKLIAIGETLPTQTADHLRTFVEREHPRAKVVTIGNSADEPFGVAHWLSASNPNDDLVQRVRQVLSQPRRRH